MTLILIKGKGRKGVLSKQFALTKILLFIIWSLFLEQWSKKMSFLANTCQLHHTELCHNIDLGISLGTQNLNSFNNFFVRWNVDGLKRRNNAFLRIVVLL